MFRSLYQYISPNIDSHITMSISLKYIVLNPETIALFFSKYDLIL